MIAAQGRASAANDLDTANDMLLLGMGGFVFGGVTFVGGALVTASSCAATPLTFYALGGTGWLCVGGVITGVGGLGTLGVSGAAGVTAWGNREDAQRRFDDATGRAEEYFRALQANSAR